jgi:trimeric autotransporter adhesin
MYHCLRLLALCLLSVCSYIHSFANPTYPADSGLVAAPTGTLACAAATELRVTPRGTTAFFFWKSANSTKNTLQYRRAGETNWTGQDVGTNQSRTVENLTNKAAYEWRVLTACADGSEGISEVRSFTAQCEVATELKVLEMASTDVRIGWTGESSSVTIRWRAVGTSEWQTYTQRMFSTASLTGLTNNTAYECQVQQGCDGNTLGDFSPSLTFVATCELPKGFGLQISGVTATTFWLNRAGPTTTYELNYNPYFQTPKTALIPASSEYYTTYVLTGLIASATYESSIRTVCGDGTRSASKKGPNFLMQRCVAPTSLQAYNISTSRAQISWDGSGGDAYLFRIKPRAVANWTETPVTSTFQTLTNLANNTAYDWQVVLTCPDGQRLESAIQSFTTINCPAATDLTERGITPTGAQLSWNLPQVAGTNRILRIWATNGSYGNAFENVPASFTLTNLRPETAYNWLINTRGCANGQSTDSEVRSFTTTCAVPEQLTVTHNRTSTSFFWSSLGNKAYALQVRKKGASSWESYTLTAGFDPKRSTIGISTLPDMAYEWRVLARCFSTTIASETQSFTTPAVACTFPGSLYGTVSTQNLPFTIQLTNVPVSGTVTVQVRQNDTTTWRSYSVGIGETARLTDLPPGANYQYRLVYTCPTGTTLTNGPNSFAIECPQAQGLKATNTTHMSVDLAWQPIPNVTYSVMLLTSTDTFIASYTGLTTPSLSLTNLTPGGNYVWRVYTDCPGLYERLRGPYAVSLFYTKSCPPANVLETFEVNAASARVRWNQDGEFATGWEVLYRAAADTTWQSLTTNDRGAALSPLKPNTHYEWRVQTYCPASLSALSQVRSFTTTGYATPTELGYSELHKTWARLTWKYVPDPGLKRVVEFRAAGTTNWLTPRTGVSESAIYLQENLTPGTAYEWRLTYTWPDGQQTSAVSSFTTLTCEPAKRIDIGNLAPTRATLTWYYDGTPERYELRVRQKNTPAWTVYTDYTIGRGSYSWGPVSKNLDSLATGVGYETQVISTCPDASTHTTATTSFTPTCPPPGYVSIAGVGATGADIYYSNYENSTGAAPTAQVREVGTTAWITYQPTSTSGIDNGRFLLTDLRPGVGYELRVVNACPNSATVASAIQTFATVCTAPTSPDVRAVNTTLATLTWQGTTNETYLIRWRTEGSTTWATARYVATGYDYYNTTQTYSLTGLTNATTYEWQVQNACGSAFTSSQTFVTGCNPPRITSLYPYATQASLYWEGAGGSTRYDLIWQAVGAPTATTVTAIEGSSYFFRDLQPGTVYTVQLRTRCDGNNTSAFTAPRSFTTTVPACAAATDLRARTVKPYSATLYFQGTYELKHTIQLRPRGSTVWQAYPTVDAGHQVCFLEDLTDATAYEWRVVTQCVSGTIVSAIDSFTTSCQSPTSLTTVAMGTLGALVNWSGGYDYQYSLRWRAIGSPNWSVQPSASRPFSITGFSEDTAYEWQVANASCESSTLAYTTSVTLVPGCNVPTLGNIDPRPTATTARLYWNAVQNARYDLLITAEGAPTSLTIAGIAGGNITNNGYSLTGLTASTAYTWQVRMQCPGGTASAYTARQSFVTAACSQPTSFGNHGIGATYANLTLFGAGNVHDYGLQLRKAGERTWATIPRTSEYMSVTGLSASTAYEWRAITTCSVSQTIASAVQSFTTKACPTPIDLREQATAPNAARLGANSGISYNDSAIQTAVQYRPVGDSLWRSKPVREVWSFVIDSLQAGATYQWRVVNTCPTNVTVASGVRSFTVQCSPPTGLYTFNRTATGALVNWETASTTAQTAQVRWRAVGSTAWTVGEPASTMPYSITGLQNDTRYEYQVRLLCEGTPTGYSNSDTLTTSCRANLSYSVTVLNPTKARVAMYLPVGTQAELSLKDPTQPTPLTFTTPASTSVLVTYDLSGLQPNRTYTLRARVRCETTTDSAWSSYRFSIPLPTDHALQMVASSRVVRVGDLVSFSLTVSNTEQNGASVVIEDVLPEGVAFVDSPDSGVTVRGSSVFLPVNINAHERVTVSFRARVLAVGTFVNAAEIVQSRYPDLDSTPNSGLWDGEDDSAQVDFRTDGEGGMRVLPVKEK